MKKSLNHGLNGLRDGTEKSLNNRLDGLKDDTDSFPQKSVQSAEKSLNHRLNGLKDDTDSFSSKKSVKSEQSQKSVIQTMGYKQTEAGVIPEDWNINKLNQITTLITKGTTPHNFTSSGINYIKIESLLGDKISFEKCLFIDKYTNNNALKRSILNEGDILFAIAGATIGKCIIVPKEIIPANTNQALAIIRLKSHYSRTFVFYTLKSKLMTRYIIDNVAGGAQPNLNLEQIGNFALPIPSATEQTLIATALSDTDALISSLEKLITKKRNIKQGAMQKLLQPKEDWEVKKLGEIANINMGQSPLSEYYNNEGIGLPLIQGNADIENRKTIIRNYTSIVTKKGKIGDIILSVRAPVGEVSKATFDCCLGRGVCAINYPNEYLYHYLIYFEKSWAKISTGSTFDSVNSNQVKDLKIPIPKLFEHQTHIATILSDMDSEITALETKLEKYKNIKLGMMQNLLTGKIRLV